MSFFEGISGSTLALLILCLVIALGFECVNGFHDTANAVATVIYTKSLKPWMAVTWSGLMNFLGVLLGGTAVAFSIVHLLPVDLLINVGQKAGMFMVLSLLISAIVWNLATWYFGLPASSSHALTGAILGVGLASSVLAGHGFSHGVNWGKAQEIGLSLLISPLLGFVIAGGILLLAKLLIRKPALYQEPDGENPPPPWIRAILVLTCTLVSYFHGSNDGQKGVGLIMLILIGLLPGQFALNTALKPEEVTKTIAAIQKVEPTVQRAGDDALYARLESIRTQLSSVPDPSQLPAATRTAVRADILRADDALGKLGKTSGLSDDDKKAIKAGQSALRGVVDFAVFGVIVAVALALGVGTTVGWKRIVVTVGEKIGKTHLTYAQGASAEITAAALIGVASWLGLPVSTTHVLSSGIAGTMAANRSGLQPKTVRNIALAWVLTLPATMILAAILFSLTAGGAVKELADQGQPVTPVVQPKVSSTSH